MNSCKLTKDGRIAAGRDGAAPIQSMAADGKSSEEKSDLWRCEFI
jgi:hypothetical protein